MRIAAQVLLAYMLILVCGSVWRFLPLDRAAPDLVALSAVYLGLTARSRLAPSTLGAVIVGYLGDLFMGTPRGALALVGGIICILGHLVHRRLLVRGWFINTVLAFLTGIVAGVIGLLVRVYGGRMAEGMGPELRVILYSALVTALVGPLILRLCRVVDTRFARTHREREAAIEGLT